MAILTGTVISAVLGVVSGALPDVLDFFKKKRDYQHELALEKLRLDALDKNAEIDFKKLRIEADVREGESIRDHDASLSGGRFIESLRASVRPILTYLFFAVFVIVKILAFHHAVTVDGVTAIEAIAVVWDAETQALFAAVIGFWFGSRQFEKRLRGK